jgi:hypothetical protein
MKLKLLIFSLLGILLTGCSTQPNPFSSIYLISQLLTKRSEPLSATQHCKSSPDSMLRAFIERLATNECKTAKQLSTKDAKQELQAIIDAGCAPYESGIMSISLKCKRRRVVATALKQNTV